MTTPNGLDLFTPGELYMMQRDTRLDAVPDYWLRTFFTESLFSQDGEIRIADLPAADRRMAPFVLPTEQGKPVFQAKGERVRALTPPYVKPKDAVRAVEARNIRPSEVLSNRPLSLQERFDARVAEVQRDHLRKIRTREAWMGARAFLDGKVTIAYERDQGTPHPEVTIDFGRNADHTVVKSANFWDDPNTLIFDDVQMWGDRMNDALYGGFPTRLYVGSKVRPVFRKNKQVERHLDLTKRGSDSTLATGIIRSDTPLSYMGELSGGIEVWSYKDHVELNDGTTVDILDPSDIALVAPGATGVRAYGAIYDAQAMLDGAVNVDIYSKMSQPTFDPGDIFLMSQSAPLPIPLYPNRTLKATVIAG